MVRRYFATGQLSAIHTQPIGLKNWRSADRLVKDMTFSEGWKTGVNKSMSRKIAKVLPNTLLEALCQAFYVQ
jgi:hypothetical protein